MHRSFFFAMALATLCLSSIMADVPHYIGYQGRLTDDAGNPVDTVVNVTFYIYGTPGGGPVLWTETHANVAIIDGLFKAHLGTYEPVDGMIADGTGGFLGVQIGDGPVGTPFSFIASTAFALRSLKSDTADYAIASGGGGLWELESSVLYTAGYSGIARGSAGNTLFGNQSHTNVNLGNSSTVGYDGRNQRYVTVGGGNGNIAEDNFATISGGSANIVGSAWGFVGGGSLNHSGSDPGGDSAATIAGGYDNYASSWGFVGGGANNRAGYKGAVGGGVGNYTTNHFGAVAGGEADTVECRWGAVGGGFSNRAGDEYSDSAATVSGGYNNSATGSFSTVVGGQNNVASGRNSVVIGGNGNVSSGSGSVVGGGGAHEVTAGGSFVGSGWDNDVLAQRSFIGSGGWNQIEGEYSVIAGGSHNFVGWEHSAIGGGESNAIFSRHSAIPGGQNDTLAAAADFSMVFGNGVWLTSAYRVVLFEGNNHGRLGINRDTHDGGIDHPIHVGTNTSNGNGAHLTAGGTWQNGSSRSFKEGFKDIDGQALLETLASLSVKRWNYRQTAETHIGPVAEDFVAMFDVGTTRADGHRDNRYLAPGDVAGVALIGVQELARENDDLRNRVIQLEALVQALLEKTN